MDNETQSESKGALFCCHGSSGPLPALCCRPKDVCWATMSLRSSAAVTWHDLRAGA